MVKAKWPNSHLALSKIVVAIFAVALACGLGACPALADDSTQGQEAYTLRAAQEATIPASGTWGTCPWTIDADGVLTVYPGTSPDWGDYLKDGTPWNDWANLITKAVFVKGENGEKVIDRGCTSYDNEPLPLFLGMKNLKEVDLRGLDVSRINNFSEMFEDCASLTSVDLSPLDMSKVESVVGMFRGCTSLTSVNLSPLKNAPLGDVRCMFYDCSSLTSIDLPQVNLSGVYDMQSMFKNCSSLSAIDLSAVNTSSVSCVGMMFAGCTNLKTIYVGDNWFLEYMESLPGSGPDGRTAMFEDCTSLEGGSGTTYNEGNKSYKYAHIDTPDNPGYFTRKGTKAFLDVAYSFENSWDGFGYPSNYVIPIERYQLLFGSKRAKQFQEADGQWGGNCYGMSSSSTMMNTAGSGIAASGFKASVVRPRELGIKDNNSNLGLNLTAFIEVMQVSQHDEAYGNAFDTNSGASRVLSYVRQQTLAGNPVVISIFRTPFGYGGHAIVAYDVEKTASGYDIEVYDNNWPDRGRSIHVSTNSSGQATGWSYELWSGLTYKNGRIVFVPYSVYNDVWQARGTNKAGGTTNVLSTNSKDFDILDANGNTIAHVVDGLLQEDDAGEGVWQHHAMRATEDNIDDEQEVVLSLPNGLCRIENKDSSVAKLEASVSDQEQIATVKTDADNVELAVNDESASNVAMVFAAKGVDYDVTLESALKSAEGKEVVEVTGKGTGSNVTVGMSGGTLNTATATGATVMINGKELKAEEPKEAKKETTQTKKTVGIADGQKATAGGSTYLVKSNAMGTVYYDKAPKSKKSITIPAEVEINGKVYEVIGISKKAFKGTKVKTVTVKTAKLTKKTVQGCFKGAKKIKTVKVKVGSKSANKKAVKKYKKIFTKKNAGKKVTVK